MKERIKEIIAYLMNPESQFLRDPSAAHGKLESMGYSHEEINQAMKMLDFNSTPSDSQPDLILQQKTRILGEAEKLILSTSAQGYLIKLHRMGWLTEAQLSLIIENAALEFSPPVSLDETKEMVSRYISDLPEDINEDAASLDKQTH